MIHHVVCVILLSNFESVDRISRNVMNIFTLIFNFPTIGNDMANIGS